MDFLYKQQEEIDYASLCQGDVLRKSDAVSAVMSQAHRYYAEAPHYTHFIILTQSCDLVRRNSTKQFRAPYISIAAVCPLSREMSLVFDNESKVLPRTHLSFVSKSTQKAARDKLERLIHNTEPEHFFLPAVEGSGIIEDSLAYLRLSIALRKEHYDVLVSAKIAELSDVFQAKLGWLVGNIYSRVGTPDLESRSSDSDEIKRRFFQRYAPDDRLPVLTGLQANELRRIAKVKVGQLNRDLTAVEAEELLKSALATDAELLARKIVDELVRSRLLNGDPEDLSKAQRVIANTPDLKQVTQK